MTTSRAPIAIIGSSCCFAGGASSPSKLWDLLLNPRDISAPPPSTRFNLGSFYDHNPERHGHTNVCGSYFLTEDPCAFDSVFFNISPKEAEAIDPQQRLLLELAYEAIESAGLTLQGLRGSDTSVYVGLMIRDYLDVQTRDPDYFSKYMVTGTSSALNANRISYFFDWHGPSLTVDTACSSSLVAVHQAIQGLRCGESRVALVAGTNLLLGPELFISASQMRMLSSRSRMWDASAEGYARGDGFATFVLKTLPNAIADGDSIEAIIRETGVNSDGHTKGITLPSPVAQAALIRETYKRAGLDISQAEGRPQYIEAHGTGTQAGDPLEASAIHQAFFGDDLAVDPASSRIWTGSIKTVIGHTEGAAGMAGMLKALLAMKHRKIPPNLHFHEPNSSIAPFHARLPIPTEPVPWPKLSPGTPVRVSVNSFGFGGTNAHAILESYEPEATATQPLQHHKSFIAPLVLSAHSETALQTLVKEYSSFLKSHHDTVCLRDLAYTLCSRRSTLPVRAFFSGVTTAEIAKDMDQRLLPGKDIGHRSPDGESKPYVLGIFTGQGAQWPTMGKHLIENSRIFSETIDRLEMLLASLPDGPRWSLREEILAPKSKSRLNQAALSQPLCTAIAIALVELLRASGITFSAVVGHSSGEIGAAYAAGVIDSSEAMKIAYYRGVHAQHAGTNNGHCGDRGGMIAVGMGLKAAKDFCSLPRFVGRLDIAASNSASNVTLSGDVSAIKEAKDLFDSQNIFARVLQVDTAYHSHYMDPCAEPYMTSLIACDIQAQGPETLNCAWISSVYGSEGAPTVEELKSTYWKDNMIKPVLFSQAVERALIEYGPFDAAIEVGPGPALKGPVSQTTRDVSDVQIPYIATLDRRKNDVISFGEALASLWLHFGSGVVDFEGYITASEPLGLDPPALVKDDLPSYPWDHSQAFWRESRLSREYRLRLSASNELLGHFVPGGNSEHALRWRNILRLNEVPWIGCHRFEGTAIVPTSAFCLMAIEAGMKLASVAKMGFEIGTVEVRSLEIFGLVAVPDGYDGVELSTSIQRIGIHSHDSCFVADFLVLFGSPDGTTPLRRAASARIALLAGTTEVAHHDPRKSKISDDLMEDFEAAELFDSLSQMGLEYTGPFRSLQKVRTKWRHSNALFCDPLSSISTSWVAKPFLIEGCIQTAYAAFATPGGSSLWSSFLPSRIQKLSINPSSLSKSASRLEIDSRIAEATHVTSHHGASFHAEIEVLDGSGNVLMEFEGLEILSRGPASPEDDREIFFQTVWERSIDDGIQTTWPIQPCSDLSVLDGRRLLVIGGKTSPTNEAIQSIGLLLGSWRSELVIVDSFNDLRLDEHWDLAGAIVLTDIDCPLVESIESLTSRAHDCISQIFRQLSPILWVTSGAWTCNAGQAASIGLVQSLSAQHPFANTQLLDVDTLKGSEKQIVSSFLRLLISSLPDFTNTNTNTNTNSLHTVERQIAIRDGHEWISRVLPIRDMNNRLNSQRRVIKTQVSKSKGTSMSITPRGSIDLASYHVDSIGPDDGNSINVSFSLPFAVKVSLDTFLYLFAGNNESGGSVIGFSKTLNLPGRPSAVWKVPEGIQISDARLLELCSSTAVAKSIFDLLPSGRSVIFEPGQILASLISDLAKETDRDVSFITSSPLDHVGDAWISIPAQASKRAIWSALPPDLKLLFVVPDGPDGSSRLVARIQQSLSPNARIFDRSAIFSLRASAPETVAVGWLEENLGNLCLSALEASQRMPHASSLPRINPGQLLDGSPQSHSGLSIVEWEKMTTVVAAVEGRNPNAILFSHKIYLLVQLQPQLLQSISHWLVSCGVRKLMIVDTLPTSCRGLELGPNVSVQVMQVDLTDLSEVRQLINGLPDIGGVIYGGSLVQLPIEYERPDFSRAWRDMISTSRNLTETLVARIPDFFIMLSSEEEKRKKNHSTSSYPACLTLQARSRGLAASFVDLAASWRTMSISESDMHYILTEAIYVSNPGSLDDPLILARLKPSDEADSDASASWEWLRQPGLSREAVSFPRSKESSGGTGRAKSLRERLDTCHDYEVASAAIWEFLRPQLASLLSLVLDRIKPEDDLVSLGVDSLSASDLRAWFLREIDEDIPMVKILGSSTISQLCDEAAATLSLDIMGTGMTSTSKGSVTISSSPGVGTPLNSDNLHEVTGTDYFEMQRPERQSLNQTRLWFPSLCLDQKTPFNCTTSYSMSGPLDASRLDSAFKLLIQRHQSFRTSFFNEESTGEPMQRTLKSSPFMLKVMLGNRDEDVRREFRRIHAYHFDLAVADTFIATLISHGDGQHTIITGYHHIIMDGVSWQITLRDLAMFYQSETPELPPFAQYVDFATKQRQVISNDHDKQKLEFWRNEFPVPPGVMPLFPFAKVSTRKTLTQYNTIDIVLDVESSLVARIKKASLKAKSTSFHFYLSAFVVLVTRCLEMDEICLGIIDANRSDKMFLNTIGFMLDMLPLKLKVNKRERFLHTLQCTRKKAYSVLEHSGVPLDAIIKELQIPASSTHTPMFQILINYRMGALRAPDIGEAKMDFLSYEDAKAPFDLTLSIDEKDDGTGMLTFSMHDYMYDRKGAELLASTYVHLLEVLSHDPSQRLNSVSLSSQGASGAFSKALAIRTGPIIDFGWPQTQTISHRVDHQTRQHPDRLAVKDLKGRSRTYLATFKRVNALAQELTKSGITHGSRVAVYCEPSVDIIACILAVHRVGATYIPLDVRNSPERLGATVEECDPALILYDSNTKGRVFDFVPAGKSTLDISTVPESTELIVPNVSRLSDDAFILYTSGSTGRPKGIGLTQASLSIHCASISDKLELCHRDIFLQQSALGFDAALGQMLYALTNGGVLILGNNRDDPRELALLMEREKVTFTLFIISEVLALLQYGSDVLSRCTSWRMALCGGEAFTGRLLSRFRSLGLPNLVLYNAYGPTEGSIICSMGAVPYHDETFGEDTTIPCGPPLANYGVYVLDDQLRPVPVGWPGELCISGPCVASCYVGQPVLTAAKFQVDRLQRPNGACEGWTTIYRTGDRARMLDDGSFIFLGRIDGDSQVKLRGIRIELGEVTGAIIKASKGAIADAVTIVSGSAAQTLVSFVVFSQGGEKRLPRDYLRKLVQNLPLPTYMRPAVAIPLDHFPVTARGKLDIQALSAYKPADEEADEDAVPLTETEHKLKEIWQKTLPEHGLRIPMPVRKTSDFFSVGGNSLLLIRLRAAIRDAFGIDVPLADLFQASTLESLAARLESSRSLPAETIDWEEETTLDTSLPRAKNIRSLETGDAAGDAEPIEVVLTGGAGFLGSEIVRQLLAHPMVARIHCVAVRPGRTLSSSDSQKIAVHTGDLALPFLGLGEDEARGIFSKASAIIHNGAEVSHMKTYQSLRRANVGSTEQLIDLALRTTHEVGAPVPSFHFISSAGVGGLVGALEFPEISVSSYPPAAEEPGPGPNGYIAAKYASEVLLERASQLGLPVTIHRPSNISGLGVQDRDIVHSIWRWSERMRAVPDLVAAGAVGAFDFVGVESCAAGIIRSVFQGLRGGGHAVSVRYLHQSGERVIPIASFAEAMEDILGMEVEVLPFEEWIERAVEMGGDELVVSFLKQTRGALCMPLLRFSGNDGRIETDQRP